MTRSAHHLVSGAVPLVLGLFAAWASLQLHVGTFTAPGPGLWPLIVSVALVVTSILLLLLPEAEKEEFTRRSMPIGVAMLALAVFVVLFQLFGFVLPAALLLLAWLRYLSHETWRSSILVTLVAVASLYVTFVFLLGVPFPYDLLTGR